jgi:GDP-L-fucose synthase
MNNDMDSVRQNLKQNPIENIVEDSSNNEILDILSKYGISKNSILLWGSGNPKREFLHADDLADACTFLMENVDYADIIKSKFGIEKISSPPELEIRNTHINIGTGKDLTINELAHLIKKIVGYQGVINWDSSKPDGTFQKLLDVSKLHDLGWKEKIELEDGISKVFANYVDSNKKDNGYK